MPGDQVEARVRWGWRRWLRKREGIRMNVDVIVASGIGGKLEFGRLGKVGVLSSHVLRRGDYDVSVEFLFYFSLVLILTQLLSLGCMIFLEH